MKACLVLFSAGLVCLIPFALNARPGVVRSSDFPSLQQVFDAVPESGGIIYIAPGTYELHEPLILRRENLRIEGAGPATHIINKNESGQPALHIRPDGYAQDRRKRLWRIQLGNLRISGNPNSGTGVHAQGIQEIFIHGLSVGHHGKHGIYLDNCFEDPRVADSIITYNAEAGLNITECQDIVVSDNVNRIDVGTGIVLDNTSGINITGNSFSGMTENAVRDIGENRRILISGNLLTDLHRNSTGKLPAFSLGDPDTSNLIKDNIVQ